MILHFNARKAVNYSGRIDLFEIGRDFICSFDALNIINKCQKIFLIIISPFSFPKSTLTSINNTKKFKIISSNNV